MLEKTVGRTNIKVSELSFGTVSLGLPYGIGVKDKNYMLTDRQSCSLLNTALDSGVNFYDTAKEYGKSEEILGRAFKDKRNEVVICTKPAHLYDIYKGQSLPLSGEITKVLNESLVHSLNKLQTDYIDIYMSHNGTEEVIENDTVIGFFQNLMKKGVIRATGISVYTIEQSLKAIKSGVWDVIQLQFNLMDQRQLPAIEFAKEKGVGIIIRSVLFKGILTDRGSNLHPELKAVEEHREKYLPLIRDDIGSLSELATKFVLSFDGVSSVLIGIDKPEYLEQALKIVNGKYLDEQTLLKAKEFAYPDPDFLNLPVWDRKGWL